MFILRRKWFTLNNSYDLKDESGNNLFTAKGRFFSPGKYIRIYNSQNEELFLIKKKLFRFMPEYEIYESGQLAGRVKRQPVFDKYMVFISGQYINGAAESKFWSKRFIIYENESALAMTQKVLSLAHVYKLKIAEGQNQALITAICIILDMMFRKYTR